MFKKLILSVVLFLLSIGGAFAACTNPLAIKDAAAASISMSMSSGGDGFCQYNFNLNQINATAIATGSGVMGAGTQRTALATDSPGIVTLGQTTKSASVPVAIASDQLGGATVANSLPVVTSSQYPANATAAAAPITASATGTTGATTATLAGVSSKTTFICGFTITSDATAALAGTATVTGTITGTLNYIQNVGGATAAGILTQSYAPCIPASAANTGIAINSVAAGTGGNTAVTAWGYQL